MFFCDWLNVWQQFPAGVYPDYIGGRVVSIDGACGLSRKRVIDMETGECAEEWAISGSDEIEFDTAKFGHARGSFETTIMIRMVGGKLEVRGNPSAYGRLDNLFGVGVDDGIGIYNSILVSLGLPEFTQGEIRILDWDKEAQQFKQEYSGACITRVDLTVNQSVGMGRVRDYNRWLAGQKLSRSSPDDKALEKFAQWDFETVYTSNSVYWINSKHYDKSAALENLTLPEYMKKLRKAARAGTIQKSEVRTLYLEAEDYLLKLAEWCAELGIVRSEWSIRSRWFQQHVGMGFWKPNVCESELLDVATKEREKISMRAVVHQAESYDNLTGSEYKALDRWKKGEALKVNAGGSMSDTTFYRLRSSIMKKTGHDIAARPTVKASTTEYRPVYFQVRALSMAQAPVWYQRPSYQPQLMAA